jgi:hypothetical protein
MPATEVGTNYAVYRPDVWSSQVNRFFYNKLALAPFLWNLTDEVTGGGKTLVVPSTTETFSAKSITTTTGEVTSTTIDDTVIRLDINKWYASSRIVADFQAAQIDSKYGGLELYQQDMGYALAKQLDSDLIEIAGDKGYCVLSTGTSTSSLSTTSLEQGMALMESYGMDRSDLLFVFHPIAYWNGPMKRQKLYDASQFGKPSLPQGIHDMLYGVPVIITQQVHKDGLVNQSTGATGQRKSGYNNMLIHKRKACYALGNLSGPKSAGIRIKVGVPSEHLRTKYIADIMYGVKNVSTTRGVRLVSSTGAA